MRETRFLVGLSADSSRAVGSSSRARTRMHPHEPQRFHEDPQAHGHSDIPSDLRKWEHADPDAEWHSLS